MEKKNNYVILIIIIIACLAYGLSNGIRSNYGLIREAIQLSSGVNYANVSFILATAQLVFGIMQPLFGIVALKKSNAFVLRCGAILTIFGLVLIPICQSLLPLLICLGILMPAGLGAFSFGVIMGAVTPILGEKRAAVVSGIVSASSGLGSIILAPVLTYVIDIIGIWGAIIVLCIPAAILLPTTTFFHQSNGQKLENHEYPKSFSKLFNQAIKNPSFIMVTLAFFSCGFHMAIIETHLYTQLTHYGFSNTLVAYAFSAYGIATMLGSIISGYLISKFSAHKVLGCIYGIRPVLILLFLILPKTVVSMYSFCILLGLSGAATVPPTSGLISRIFGSAALGTLMGIAFASHQIGSFFSTWLGGLGNYYMIWFIDIILCIFAAILSFLSKDRKDAK